MKKILTPILAVLKMTAVVTLIFIGVVCIAIAAFCDAGLSQLKNYD